MEDYSELIEHSATFSTRNTRFTRARSAQQNVSWHSTHSFTIPDMPDITDLMAGARTVSTPTAITRNDAPLNLFTRTDATPTTLTRNPPSRSRFSSTGQRQLSAAHSAPPPPLQPQHQPMESLPLPQEEKQIYGSLQMAHKRVDSLELERLELMSRIDMHQEEIIGLRNQIAANHDRPDSGLGYSDDEAELSKAKAKVTELEAAIKTHKDLLDRSKAKSRRVEVGITKMAAERTRLIEQLGTAYSDIHQLETELKQSTQANQQVKDELHHLQKDYQSLIAVDQELRQVVEALKKDQQKVQDKFDEWNHLIQATIDQNQQLRNENADLKEEIHDLHTLLEETKSSHSDETEQRTAAEFEVANLTIHNNTLTDENKNLTNNVHKLTEANKTLTDDNHSLTDENSSLTDENKKLANANKDLTDKLTIRRKKLDDEVKTITEANKGLKKNFKIFSSNARDTYDMNELLVERCQQLKKELHEVKRNNAHIIKQFFQVTNQFPSMMQQPPEMTDPPAMQGPPERPQPPATQQPPEGINPPATQHTTKRLKSTAKLPVKFNLPAMQGPPERLTPPATSQSPEECIPPTKQQLPRIPAMPQSRKRVNPPAMQGPPERLQPPATQQPPGRRQTPAMQQLRERLQRPATQLETITDEAKDVIGGAAKDSFAGTVLMKHSHNVHTLLTDATEDCEIHDGDAVQDSIGDEVKNSIGGAAKDSFAGTVLIHDTHNVHTLLTDDPTEDCEVPEDNQESIFEMSGITGLSCLTEDQSISYTKHSMDEVSRDNTADRIQEAMRNAQRQPSMSGGQQMRSFSSRTPSSHWSKDPECIISSAVESVENDYTLPAISIPKRRFSKRSTFQKTTVVNDFPAPEFNIIRKDLEHEHSAATLHTSVSQMAPPHTPIDMSAVDTTDATMRPSEPPAAALAAVVAELGEELRLLKEKLANAAAAYNELDPAVGRRGRGTARRRVEGLMGEVERRSEQLYKLHDAGMGIRE